MAEFGIDTSSYPKPQAPVNPLDTLGKVTAIQQGQQFLQSGALTIDKQKLDLVNQRFAEMAKGMTGLLQDPDLNETKIRKYFENQVKLGYITPEMAATTITQLPPTQGMDAKKAATALKMWGDQQLDHARTITEALNWHAGQPQLVNTGNSLQPVQVSPKFGYRSSGLPIAANLPPGTTGYDSEGKPMFAPPNPNAVSAPPPMPGTPTVPNSQPTPLPVARPTPSIPAPVSERIDAANGFKPGTPPLFEEGKKALGEDQLLASQKLTAIKPALEAYKLLPGLRSGPGTEPFNKAVAFLKANNIISTEEANDPTAVYQEANKYLSQYLKGRGGRSDADLAAAEKSSPNVAYQINPALMKLTRTAIGQDRIEAARSAAFTGSGRQDYQNYGAHRASFPQSIDDRAFSLDLMPETERKDLVKTMLDKYKKNPQDKEAVKFLKSYDIAKKQGFLDNE